MPLPLLTSYKQILYPTPAVAQLVDDIVTNRVPFPANGKNGLIIYGPTGTGKTSLMKLLPDALEAHRSGEIAYMPKYEPIDETTKPSTLFTSIKKHASNHPLMGTYNYILLDEVDLLKSTGLMSLKSVMGLPLTVFIFATNNLNVIDPPIRSRCLLIDMNPPPPSNVLGLFNQALAAGGVTQLPPDSLIEDTIASCHGDMRTIGEEIDRAIAEKTK